MVNHNVRFTFAVRIADGIATGIWASSVLSTYINVLEGDNDMANEKVGYAQAIQGTFLATAAIAAGWLAITQRRDSILKIMGLVAFAAIATTSFALILEVPYKYELLCCGLALWGVAQANAPVLDALFADSVPTGNRSELYTWMHMSYIVAQGIGPGVGAIIFALHGNVWSLEVLQRVMMVGMTLAVVPALLMLCFDDDKALGAESEGLLRAAVLRRSHEAAGAAGPGDPGADSHGSDVLQSPGGGGGGEPDYRRPFLDNWCSDMERDFRNQSSVACSPARAVFPAVPSALAKNVAASSGAGGGSYIPPDFVSAAGDRDGSSSELPDGRVQTVAGTVAGATAPAPYVGSHALLLSPISLSPTTDRSGATTPLFSASPARLLPSATTAAAANGGSGGTAGYGLLIGGRVEAVAENLPRQMERVVEGSRQQPGGGGSAGEGGGQELGRQLHSDGAAMAPPAVVRRLDTVRQTVDGAVTATAETPSRAAQLTSDIASTPLPPPPPDQLPYSRSVSTVAGRVTAAWDSGFGGDDVIACATATEGKGDVDNRFLGSSLEASLMSESMPSELSFHSLLPAISFKSAYSRTFSRTCSSSSGGSGRGGNLTPVGSAGVAGGGSGCLASSACVAGICTAHGVLPYLQEEDGGTADPEPSQNSVMRQTGTGAMSAVGPSDRAAFPEQGGGFRLPYDRMKSSAVPTDHAEIPAVAVMALADESGRVIVGIRGGGTIVTTGSVASSQWPQTREAVSGVVVTQRPLSPPPPPPLLTTLHHFHPRNHRFLCLTVSWIPGVLALTDCIMGLASGMTIKFFPIFFKDEVQLSPMYVNLMYCAIPLCLAACAYLAQRESRVLGRVQTMVLNRAIGITLLYWIAKYTDRWHDKRLMVAIYIARTSIMNSAYSLQKSILMDYVPKDSRAVWNSLESVNSFGWSGSAALGGWLIHKFSFQTTFLITATMQCMGWGISLLLLPIVPRRESGVLLAVCPSGPAATDTAACGTAGGSGIAGGSPVRTRAGSSRLSSLHSRHLPPLDQRPRVCVQVKSG